MKKLLMAVAAVFAVASIASAAAISWGVTSPAVDDGGNPLDGGMAYLVYLGSNGTLDATFDGTSWDMGGDQIVGAAPISGSATTTYVGSWGFFSATTPVTTDIGAVYAIIVTDAGTATDALPTTGFYGVSGTYTQTKDGPSDTEDFAYGNSVSVTTPVGVPEPTTYALIGIAAAALALRKRFLKK